MAGHPPDRERPAPGPGTVIDSSVLAAAPAGEPMPNREEGVRWLDRSAWLALLPWGCSVPTVLVLAWAATLASRRLR